MRGVANAQPERLAYIVRLRLDYTWSHFRQHLVDGRNCRYYFTHTLLLATHLDQLEAWNYELASDKFQLYREKVNGLTVQRTTELHRVEYSSQE